MVRLCYKTANMHTHRTATAIRRPSSTQRRNCNGFQAFIVYVPGCSYTVASLCSFSHFAYIFCERAAIEWKQFERVMGVWRGQTQPIYGNRGLALCVPVDFFYVNYNLILSTPIIYIRLRAVNYISIVSAVFVWTKNTFPWHPYLYKRLKNIQNQSSILTLNNNDFLLWLQWLPADVARAKSRVAATATLSSVRMGLTTCDSRCGRYSRQHPKNSRWYIFTTTIWREAMLVLRWVVSLRLLSSLYHCLPACP